MAKKRKGKVATSYSVYLSQWADQFYRTHFESRDKNIFVFFRTLRRGTWAESYRLGDVGFIFVSDKLTSLRSISQAVKHELIHIHQGNASHGKRFKAWVLKLNLNPKRHCPRA